MASTTQAMQDASPLLRRPAELRAQAARDGYLYFQGLLPVQTVRELRLQILQICDAYGWLDRSHQIDVARANHQSIEAIPADEIGFCGVGIPRQAYADVQRLELFHCLAHHPSLLAMYETLFGEGAFVHPRNIGRIMLPASATPVTPPHQDFVHVQGTQNTWTCWIPLGDCPHELGGLQVLGGSHAGGIRAVQQAGGAGGLEAQLCDDEAGWAGADYDTGDVLTFSSLTVHRSLPNLRNDTVRLSCDFRYQPASQQIEAKSLQPHCQVLEWDQIYAGWRDRSLQYYWRRHHLELSPWDESVRWQKEHICD